MRIYGRCLLGFLNTLLFLSCVSSVSATCAAGLANDSTWEVTVLSLCTSSHPALGTYVDIGFINAYSRVYVKFDPQLAIAKYLYMANGQPKEFPYGKHLNETFTLSNLNILSVKPLITALSSVGFQPGTGHWNRDITFRPPNQLDPRMGTGSATISLRRTEASDKTLYEMYVTRTKSLEIQGQDSQPTWHLHRSDLLAEIEKTALCSNHLP